MRETFALPMLKDTQVAQFKDAFALPLPYPEFAKRYLELLSDADTSDWQAASGAEESLARLQAAGQRLALLTGNPEPVARARLERLGL